MSAADDLIESRKREILGPKADKAAPLTEQPEFQAAVDAAVAQAIAALLPKLQQQSAASMPADETGSVFDRLAMAIAQLTDQGTGQPARVPPEILLARAEAKKRMYALIRAAAESENIPTYRLVAQISVALEGCGETLIEPLWRGSDNRVYPTEIKWLGVPNLAMEPTNDAASEIMQAFAESIGNRSRQALGVDTDLALTPNGHVVKGAVASLISSRDRDRAGPGQHAGIAMVQNEAAQLIQQHGAPAYVDVHVLGSIVPPARQNG